jgi:hypothetical protein
MDDVGGRGEEFLLALLAPSESNVIMRILARTRIPVLLHPGGRVGWIHCLYATPPAACWMKGSGLRLRIDLLEETGKRIAKYLIFVRQLTNNLSYNRQHFY